MISTQKKLLYGLALLVSSSLFAHELVKAMRSEGAPPSAERPAEMGGVWTRVPDQSAPIAEFEGAEGSEADVNFGAPWAEASPAPAESATRPTEDVLASLERALQVLEKNSAVEGSGRLASLESATGSHGVNEAPSPGNAPSTNVREPGERRDDGAARARLQRFLDEAPLMGMVCSESESVALFGGRAVRVGEFLLGADGRVTACNALGVNVSVEGCDLWVALPAVRTRNAPTPQAFSAPNNPPAPAADSGAPAQ